MPPPSSQPAIRIHNLGKKYRISHEGNTHGKYKTLRDSLANLAAAPLRRLRSGGESTAAAEDFWALKDVSFDVQPGEVVGIIGRNGAGKSTLLKILSRITKPSTGTVELNGRVGSLLEVGTGFHPELTGRENIFLNGSILGMKRAEIQKQFDAIVDFSGVEKFLDTPVKRYSSGMYVRLAFAVASHLEPEILIVDEVLSVGDAEFQKKCLGKMHEVSYGGGRTVLFVSHNMAAIRQLCDTGLLLQNGSLTLNGSVEDCIERYSDMHLAEGRIKDRVSYSHDSLTINSVSVNGRESTRLPGNPDLSQLVVEVEGIVHSPRRVELELLITDSVGAPLAFFSPGHLRGHSLIRPKGDFRISHVVKLPRMNKGRYWLNLNLTEPGVTYWLNIPNAVQIDCEGTTTATGHVFEYAKGAGWVLLTEEAAVTQ